MHIIKFIYHKLKGLFWAIVPFKLYSESVDLGAVDREYRPEIDKLDNQERQLQELRSLSLHTIDLIQAISSATFSSQLLLDIPELIIQFINEPENMQVKSQIHDYLNNSEEYTKAHKLSIKILEAIYAVYPGIKKFNNIVIKAGAGQDE